MKRKIEQLQDAVTQMEKRMTEYNAISIGQAAEIRGTTQAAVTQLIKRGRIPFVTILGHPYMILEDVEGFAKEQPGPRAVQPSELIEKVA